VSKNRFIDFLKELLYSNHLEVMFMESNIALNVKTNLPTLQNFNAYKHYVKNLPNLSSTDERDLLEKFKDENDLKSAQKLIMSQLKTVLHVAFQYRNYGLPEEDLVQEGNIGLMKAVKNYDLKYQVRLYTYALVWIKAEIQGYILKNWKLVKIGTTKNLKKLFFNFKQIQKEMIDEDISHQQLTKLVSKKLNVSEEEVREIEQYFASEDMTIDLNQDEESPMLQLGHEQTPETQYMQLHDETKRHQMLDKALGNLTPRQADIVKMRYFDEEKKTHKEIALTLGISSERVRQIENDALKKMKKTFVEDFSIEEIF
jgi:RNA polymerase sigma-32 factor